MSRKRSAPSQGSVLDEIDHPLSSPSKRPRVEDDEADSEDSTEEPNGEQVNGHDEIPEDDVDAFEQDEEEVDELNEQSEAEHEAMAEEYRTQKDGRDGPAESGVIDRVDLKNFMCHKHLTMKLGQQLNFVIGHNGSGKSAILTGITIALGGKAASTNRGSSLKSFIREGADAAEVILTMRNEGVEAFKPTVYGPKLIIERRITATSTSWKVKSSAGKLISSKREEVDAYCDHTNIQVDNPMNVLSQDAARQFLSTSHAKDKYSFFLKGTQLNQLAAEYTAIGAAVSQMKLAVGKHEDTLPDLERQVRDTMNRYKVLDKARSRKEELVKLQEQMVWSQVYAKEREVKAQRGKMEKAQEKLHAVRKDIEKLEAELESLDAEIKAVEDRAKESREREAPLRDDRVRLQQEYKAQQTRLTTYKEEKKRLNEQFSQYQDDIDRLQKQIDDEAARLAQDNRAQFQRLQAEREECLEERTAAQNKETDLTAQFQELEQQSRPLRARCDELKREIERTRNHITEKQTQISGLTSSRQNQLLAYGPNMIQLIRNIEQFRGWVSKPLGPMGRYVRLKDHTWSKVIESVLSNLLSSFLVTNWQDQKNLHRMLQEARLGHCGIIVGNREEFDFSEGEPDPSIVTMRRVLEFTEPSVLRTFVDSAKIERTALVRERVHGDQLVRQTPRNVAVVFSADLFKVSGGIRGSSTQTVTEFTGVPKLSRNVDESIRRLQEELRAIEQHKAGLDEQFAEASRRLSENEKLKANTKNSIPGFGRKVRQCTQRLQQIEDDLREDEPANVAALQENKREAEEGKAKVFEEAKVLVEKIKEAEDALKPISEKIDKNKQLINAFIESRDTFTEKLEEKTPVRMKVYNLLQHRRDQLEGKESVFENEQEELAKADAELTDWTEQAEEFCPKVEAPEDPQEYQKRISVIETAADAARKSGVENIDDVLQELKTKKQALSDAQKSVQDIRDVCKLFDQSLGVRRLRWQAFRRSIALRARFLFTQHLERRGYTGSLTFDHDGEKLRLRVQTEDASKSRNKDPKSLSGGEKSFATICLLLALWEAIGCPIRCLDEFDVFMDAVNRKISMKMIADTAHNNPATQFVLITPLNMQNVNLGPQVRILRMSDPERGQGLLQTGNRG
ncbi:Structural maintenance of chromosomes protein 6 [Tilletia horrida]|uniref:Structural maintenance of chromosomes protein 6 n=1 Tax=Tilletia horrida TaxID=155126 RepID=A0AAN6GKS4_9BASI|nr:Structural maintenance of chromosomes protein 6 [Tilletia horrida]KAK0547221.1 Structural maintenance of chromosomes protein 6 [Tilletia horrida]KAK0562654.1 Structural maintenance of chromosomes protein 6 [Tilletia horrida]